MGIKIGETSVTGMTIGNIHRKPSGGLTGPNDAWQLVALYEILVELRKLNSLLHCSNFVGIPTTLRKIQANTAKPRKIQANTAKPRKAKKA